MKMNMRTKPNLRRDESGLALVSVLWALSILSLIAAAMMSSSTLSYRMERNDWQRLQTQMLAQSAIERAILGIADTRVEKRWRIDGVPEDFSIGDAHVRVRVQDEFGKIDLNAAAGDLLKGLLNSAGLPDAEAKTLADHIVDWRTPSDERDSKERNPAGSSAASYGYQPRYGPFQSVDELKLVMGMTPALFARIEPAITIYSKKADIDQRVAPKEALLALPDMDEQKADEIIADRSNPAGSLEHEASSAMPGILDPATQPSGQVFAITAEVQSAKQRVVKEAVVELTGDAKRPYLVLSWN